MQSACEQWTALAPMNKTWVKFQDMFTSAHETYEALTAQAGGYHGANNVKAQETEKNLQRNRRGICKPGNGGNCRQGSVIHINKHKLHTHQPARNKRQNNCSATGTAKK
jgi:hypothetical protein